MYKLITSCQNNTIIQRFQKPSTKCIPTECAAQYLTNSTTPTTDIPTLSQCALDLSVKRAYEENRVQQITN